MRALVLGDHGVRLDTDRPDPVPAPGDVLVRVLRAGICETDLQLMRGYKGFTGILGHEFVGVALGGSCEGRRVVGEINCSCWTCETCAAGRPGHCPNRTVIGILGRDGAFADLIAVPERNLHTDLPAVRRRNRTLARGGPSARRACFALMSRLDADLLVRGAIPDARDPPVTASLYEASRLRPPVGDWLPSRDGVPTSPIGHPQLNVYCPPVRLGSSRRYTSYSRGVSKHQNYI